MHESEEHDDEGIHPIYEQSKKVLLRFLIYYFKCWFLFSISISKLFSLLFFSLSLLTNLVSFLFLVNNSI